MASEDKKPAVSPIAAITASATRVEREAIICTAGALNTRFAELEIALAEAQRDKLIGTSLADSDPTRDIAEQLEAVRKEMAEHEHVFTMRGLPAKAWSDLRAAHAPRKGTNELLNMETFPVALVAASCVAIDGTETTASEDEVAALFDVLNDGQRDQLFEAAWEANTGRLTVPFSARASAVLRSIEQS